MGKSKSSKKEKKREAAAMAEAAREVDEEVKQAAGQEAEEPALKRRKLENGVASATVAPSSEKSSAAEKGEDADDDESSSDGEEDLGEKATPAEIAASKSAKAKLKKKRKMERLALENPPSFAFDTRGFKGGRPIQIKDVRDFVLHLLSDEKAQQWLYVANRRNVRRVVTVMIPGILPETLGVPAPPLSANLPFALTLPADASSQLPVFQSLFSHACPTRAPGEKNRMHSCYQAFTTCPLTGGEKERREKARKEKGQKEKTTDPSVYILTPEQMIENTYPDTSPIPATPIASPTFADWRKPDGWIEAPYQAPGPKKLFALDCEMCLTEDGSELARISIVDADNKRVYDSLVKPNKPIIDYLTQFSGLTKEMLEGVTTTLSDVQAKLAELFDYNTILLGHSLESDLRVLKLAHHLVIDTSVIYQHPRGPPFKASLKWLAQKWLNKSIQNATATETAVGGHDSEEDARTCIELLNLKMQKGATFGEFSTDQDTIFERIGRGQDSRTSAVVDHGTPGQWHGAKATTSVACTNDDEVLEGMLQSIEGHGFTFGRFMDLSHSLGWSTPTVVTTSLPGIPASALTTPVAEAPSAPKLLDSSTVLSTLNAQLVKLHASLPPLTALIIFTGHSDPREMARLSAKKAKFDKLWKAGKQSEIQEDERWMESDDRSLGDEVEKCRAGGTAYFCIKT